METSGIVTAIAEKLDIPHLIYHWKTKSMFVGGDPIKVPTVNLYPDSDTLAEAFENVLVDYTWKSYTIVYEDKENLIRLKEVLQIHGPESNAISVLQLTDNYAAMLKGMKKNGVTNVVLDIKSEKIIPFLKEAAAFNMLTDYNSYFITNLDTHILPFDELGDHGSNITCLRLVNIHSYALNDTLRVWNQKISNLHMTPDQVPLEAALVHDAVQLYYQSLQSFDTNRDIPDIKQRCFGKKHHGTPLFGHQLSEFMKIQEYDGITGNVRFNVDLTRTPRKQFQLEILYYFRYRFRRLGTWDTTDKVKYDSTESESDSQMYETISNKTFKIVVKYGTPFLKKKEAEEGILLEGNERYEGYVVDLINEMRKDLGFKYILEVIPDGQYGSLDPNTKKWNGLVKHLLELKADLAVADLTVTYERKTAVDFTMPFMNLGIGILFTKPPKKPTNLFSFLDPFTVEVWIFTALSYLSISVFVFILSRINNDDWESSHPCNQEPEEVESIWGILNCVWLCMGSIMGQGCDILPK